MSSTDKPHEIESVPDANSSTRPERDRVDHRGRFRHLDIDLGEDASEHDIDHLPDL